MFLLTKSRYNTRDVAHWPTGVKGRPFLCLHVFAHVYEWRTLCWPEDTLTHPCLLTVLRSGRFTTESSAVPTAASNAPPPPAWRKWCKGSTREKEQKTEIKISCSPSSLCLLKCRTNCTWSKTFTPSMRWNRWTLPEDNQMFCSLKFETQTKIVQRNPPNLMECLSAFWVNIPCSVLVFKRMPSLLWPTFYHLDAHSFIHVTIAMSFGGGSAGADTGKIPEKLPQPSCTGPDCRRLCTAACCKTYRSILAEGFS